MKRPQSPSVNLRNILIGLAVVVLLAIGVVYRWRYNRVPAAPVVSSSVAPVSEQDYQTAAAPAIKQLYAAVDDTESVRSDQRDALLAMRVPKAYRDLHLKLVLAADALRSGDREEARRLLASAQSDFPWIKQ